MERDIYSLAQIYKDNKKFRKVLRKIVQYPGCICGSFHPDDMIYKLSKDKQAYHSRYCPGVKAARALGILDKLNKS